MKENILNILGTLIFAGGISATAGYAGKIRLDAAQINKMRSECKTDKTPKRCEEEVIKKCSRHQTAKDCEMMIQQAKAAINPAPVTRN